MTNNTKIILPTSNTNESAIIVDPDTLTFPEGYTKYWVSDTQWTIKDSKGRMNVSFIRNFILDEFRSDKNVKVPRGTLTNASTQSYKRMRSYDFKIFIKSTYCKDLRDYYSPLLGFDPINTIKGGGNTLLNDGNFSNTGVLIGKDKEVRVNGTYMTERVFMLYAARVNYDFQEFVFSIFDERRLDRDLSSILIKPKDILEEEFDDINSRAMLKFNIGYSGVCINNRYPLGGPAKTIIEYVKYIREDYNLNIEVDQLLKWFRSEGLFHLDKLGTKHDAYDYYYPKKEFTNLDYGTLFMVIKVGEFYEVLVTAVGHDRIITELLKGFDQLDK